MGTSVSADRVLFFEGEDLGCEIVVRHFVVSSNLAQQFIYFQDIPVVNIGRRRD